MRTCQRAMSNEQALNLMMVSLTLLSAWLLWTAIRSEIPAAIWAVAIWIVFLVAWFVTGHVGFWLIDRKYRRPHRHTGEPTR